MNKLSTYLAIALIASAVSVPLLEAQAAIPFLETGQEPTLAPMLREVTPAVVNVSSKSNMHVSPNPMLEDPMFREFFKFRLPSVPEQREVQSVGSGVIVDAEKGYILTNCHVADDTAEIYVTLKDKRKFKAEVIGRDKETDIAVLKIKADHLTTIKVGDSGKLQVGDFVVAIGNPFGLGQTATSGIVSALGRNGLGIEGYENFIQTDAAINPGNSGGALTNLKGELVGINTAILSRSGGNVGIGFAIPVDMAMDVMHQLVEHGKIERGQLGIIIQDITSEIANAMDISIDQGALVAKVGKGSEAEKAGIREGDIVVKLNGQNILGAADLRNRIGLMGIGSRVSLEVIRKGEHKTIQATIGKRKDEIAESPKTQAKILRGIAVSDLPEGSDMKGVKITHVEPNSQAAVAGIHEGDIITSVNQKAVNNVKDAMEAAKQNPKAFLLNIRRGDAALFVVIQ